MIGKRIFQILLIIMTTYYMNGCTSSNDDAIAYFESRFTSVERLVDSDNLFQERLEHCVTQEPDSIEIPEEEHINNILSVATQFDNLKNLTDSLHTIIKGQIESKLNLDRAYKNLIITYLQVIEEEYYDLIQLLKQNNFTEESDRKFNNYYRKASEKLNSSLAVFYSASEEYAKENNIEIDWTE